MTISIDTALTARRAHWLAAPLLGRSSSSVSWRSLSGSQWGVCTSLCGLEGKIQDVALHSRGSDESLHCWGGTCTTINFWEVLQVLSMCLPVASAKATCSSVPRSPRACGLLCRSLPIIHIDLRCATTSHGTSGEYRISFCRLESKVLDVSSRLLWRCPRSQARESQLHSKSRLHMFPKFMSNKLVSQQICTNVAAKQYLATLTLMARNLEKSLASLAVNLNVAIHDVLPSSYPFILICLAPRR